MKLIMKAHDSHGETESMAIVIDMRNPATRGLLLSVVNLQHSPLPANAVITETKIAVPKEYGIVIYELPAGKSLDGFLFGEAYALCDVDTSGWKTKEPALEFIPPLGMTLTNNGVIFHQEWNECDYRTEWISKTALISMLR